MNRQVSDSFVDRGRGTRNPFDVMDVPNPDDQQVLEFAAATKLAGSLDDENASTWASAGERKQPDTLEGHWSGGRLDFRR
jgi:hypothetical protein